VFGGLIYLLPVRTMSDLEARLSGVSSDYFTAIPIVDADSVILVVLSVLALLTLMLFILLTYLRMRLLSYERYAGSLKRFVHRIQNQS